ncbi:hypothetical protein MTR67_049528 [Solanum verrucosum]|uniref:Uncharacterized protein n=2 Tax=Solanum TaxID=4107 RepID=A0AAF0V3L8_SOLVR|nr:uncharacterized protein LOC125818259 [Solanum verrucosum]XP_049380138.1 uncharacterized protein LOC125844835 [Solanum stenotomum]KAH0747594.1 hypothetical protein KY285_009251 [Solanum tuberosum]WMV56143.1 hypothetical protein MTR67_049528 [Solanum verrucosum]
MVNFMLEIKAELENLTDLRPQGGCDDENFRYHFKLKCGHCGEITQKETYVSLVETVPLPNGKGHTHLVQKCKFCGRDGTIAMITGRGRPLTHTDSEAGKSAPLMLFECRGFEPLDYVFRGEWEAKSLEGTKFEGIDLSGDEFAEYDEKGECPVMISKPSATFNVVR